MNKEVEKQREKLRREIQDAMDYRVDNLYVGGMASAEITKALGGKYGEDTVPELLKIAETQELKAAHRKLSKWGFVKLAKQRESEIREGARFCPHCGGRL